MFPAAHLDWRWTLQPLHRGPNGDPVMRTTDPCVFSSAVFFYEPWHEDKLQRNLNACGLFPSPQIQTSDKMTEGQGTPWGECHLFHRLYCALCPGTDPVLHRSWYKRGSECVTSYFSVAWIPWEFKQTLKTNHKGKLFGISSAGIIQAFKFQSSFNFHIPIISSVIYLCIECVCWQKSSQWERRHAVGQEMSSVSTSCLTMHPSSLS